MGGDGWGFNGWQKMIKEYIKVQLADLIPHARNPRKNDGAVDAVSKSINETGYITPIIIDEKNEILCGHTRAKSLKKLGHSEVDVLKVTGLTDEQKKRYRILDNKTGEVAEWDFEILQEDFKLEELVDLGFDIKDLDQGEVIEDEAPPIPENPKTVKGDVYELNGHRVMCGDSTFLDSIEKLLNGDKPSLLFTDPPYGVAIGDKNKMLNSFQPSGRNLTNIENDNLKPEALKEILVPIMSNMKLVCAEDCTYFVTAPQGGALGMMMMMMMMMMKESGLEARHVLMWYKNAPTFSMGRLDYDYQHEPILLTWGARHKSIMAGDHRSSVWKIDKPRSNKEHPTMKPVELYVNALRNNSEQGDFAIDPFSGSGTMLIACEQSDRKAVCIELSPHYVDVIVQRWVNFTKQTKIKRNGIEIEWPINNEKATKNA